MLSGTIAHSIKVRKAANLTSFEKNKNEAAHIVTDATKLVSIKALLIETRWKTLSSRRTKHKLLLFYKIKNNLCPPYFASLVPNNVGAVSMYDLKNVQHSQRYMPIHISVSICSSHPLSENGKPFQKHVEN